MEVVETMHNKGFSATAASVIYSDCFVLFSGFISVSHEHCNRESNQVAHEPARIAFRQKDNCTWVDEPPSCIREHLVNDVTVFANQ